MCIESVNGNQAWTNTQAAGGTQCSGKVRHHREGDHEGHGHGHAEHSRHNGLMWGIMDTLNQLGWGTQANVTETAASAVDAVSVTIEITTINISSTTITGAADTAASGANTTAGAPVDTTAPATATTTASDAASTPAAASTTDADGDDDGCGASGNLSPRQALHAFMHSLVQALNQAINQTSWTTGANQGSSTNATAAQAYGGDTTTGLRNLAQSLGSGDPASTNNPGLDALKTDFQNLLDALGLNNGATSSADPASGAQASLLSFLNALVANLSGNQDTSNGLAIGGIVNAAM